MLTQLDQFNVAEDCIVEFVSSHSWICSRFVRGLPAGNLWVDSME